MTCHTLRNSCRQRTDIQIILHMFESSTWQKFHFGGSAFKTLETVYRRSKRQGMVTCTKPRDRTFSKYSLWRWWHHPAPWNPFDSLLMSYPRSTTAFLFNCVLKTFFLGPTHAHAHTHTPGHARMRTHRRTHKRHLQAAGLWELLLQSTPLSPHPPVVLTVIKVLVFSFTIFCSLPLPLWTHARRLCSATGAARMDGFKNWFHIRGYFFGGWRQTSYIPANFLPGLPWSLAFFFKAESPPKKTQGGRAAVYCF